MTDYRSQVIFRRRRNSWGLILGPLSCRMAYEDCPRTPFFTSLDCRCPAAVNAAQCAFARRFLSYPAVGYQQVAAPLGFSMRTATFRAVSGEAYKLNDIKVTGEAIGGYGDVYVQRCDAEGAWGGMYYWLTMNGAGVEDGWYLDGMGVEPVGDDVVLNEGEGLFLTSTDSSLNLVVSGAVAKGQVPVNCPLGFAMIGNPTPVTTSLNLVTVSGEALGGYGDVYIQKCDEEGAWGGMYYWLTLNGAGVEDGWYMDGMGVEPVSGVNLEPGESVFVSSTDSELLFTFPAVL